jgi:hypothetical protein
MKIHRVTSDKIALVFLLAAAIATILASPLILYLVSRVGGTDWVVLGNIGQAYGLASALVSSIALIAVARTLSFQAKQNNIAHIHAFRSMQADVARFSFDYPEECLGTVGATTPDEMAAAKANIFRTFQARYQLAGYEMNEFTEWDVRNEYAAGLFSTEGGRNWWRWARPSWVDAGTGAAPARVRFGRILDDVLMSLSAADGQSPEIDLTYDGLAARVLSEGDIFSGKAWIPAATKAHKQNNEAPDQPPDAHHRRPDAATQPKTDQPPSPPMPNRNRRGMSA